MKGSVVVVGNGIGGSSLARSFRAMDYGVTVVSAGQATSEASLAIARSTYLPRARRERVYAESINRLRPLTEVIEGALVTSYQRPGEPARYQRDWVAIEPAAPLVEIDIEGWAEEVDGAPYGVQLTDGTWVTGNAVVWCDGEGPGKQTFGVTWVHDNPEALNFEGLRVHHLRPYHSLTGVRFAQQARIGSSSSTDVGKAREQAERMLEAAIELGWTDSRRGWSMVGGVRLQRAEELIYTDNGSWRWGGFHRSGYSIAPAEADRVAAWIANLTLEAQRRA